MADWDDAIREAYAAAPAGQSVLSCLELTHNSLPTPIRIVRSPGEHFGYDEDAEAEILGHMFTLEAEAPVNPGEEVLFQSLMFRFQKPEQSDARIGSLDISVDNATRIIAPKLDQFVSDRSVMNVIYREYVSTNFDSPSLIIKNLQVRRVRSTVMEVKMTAEFDDLVNKKFPDKIYRPDDFKGLEA